jgi:hypothetical protein
LNIRSKNTRIDPKIDPKLNCGLFKWWNSIR